MGTVVVGIILVCVVSGIVLSMVHSKKSGKSCSGCASCSMCGSSCHRRECPSKKHIA
ncbi:MAG: FeoB-associated Cys-rich membrane protein [Spirochaetaceae bacterium]|nr:FeoB-associated Cys-rich membrane protein [Spirochaetaceae bacterium]